MQWQTTAYAAWATAGTSPACFSRKRANQSRQASTVALQQAACAPAAAANPACSDLGRTTVVMA